MKENFSPKPPPKEYWDDYYWAFRHYSEIAKKYPECWVAIVDKTVIATGTTWGEARNLAFQKTKRDEFPVFFIESKRHIY